MAQFEKLTAPSQGTPIRFENGQPVVTTIRSFPSSAGTARAWTSARHPGADAAVAKTYGGSKTIEWFKVYAGDPPVTFTAPISICRRTPSKRFSYGVAIKPHHACGGIRSLNVALRQIFDLLLMPCYYEGTPSPTSVLRIWT